MKRKKKSVGGADWMATYGDFVTLLLCFFVMLYSMSSVDSQRWIALVQSFNPDAVETQEGVPPQGESEGAAPAGTSNVEQEMEAITHRNAQKLLGIAPAGMEAAGQAASS